MYLSTDYVPATCTHITCLGIIFDGSSVLCISATICYRVMADVRNCVIDNQDSCGWTRSVIQSFLPLVCPDPGCQLMAAGQCGGRLVKLFHEYTASTQGSGSMSWEWDAVCE